MIKSQVSKPRQPPGSRGLRWHGRGSWPWNCCERKHFAKGRPLPLLSCTPGKNIRQYCPPVSYHWGEAHGNSHELTVTVTTEIHPGPSMLIWKAWRNADNVTANTENGLPDISDNLPRTRSKRLSLSLFLGYTRQSPIELSLGMSPRNPAGKLCGLGQAS